MKVYRSKISYLLLGILMVVLIGTLIFTPPNVVNYIINMVVIAFTLHLFYSTTYTIDGENLTVRAGFILHEKVHIPSITKISETNSLISAPAMSFDRLLIEYGHHGEVVISPKNKSEFIADLLRINPNIQVIYKN